MSVYLNINPALFLVQNSCETVTSDLQQLFVMSYKFDCMDLGKRLFLTKNNYLLQYIV